MANQLSGGLTNFPNGLSSFGVPVVTGVPVPFTGDYIFVQEPSNASASGFPAGGSGTIASPYTRLDTAISAAASGNNDVILLLGSVHIPTAITWNKDKLHLIGVCSPQMRSKRARLSSTGSTAITPMVTVSGQGCYFSNVSTFYGIASASALIDWEDTGGRNYYGNMEFLGFGDALQAAATGARAFLLSGSNGECTFDGCVFGTDTVARTDANATLEIAGHSPRNTFRECKFEAYLTGSGANAVHLKIGSGGIDRYCDFVGCRFGSSYPGAGGSVAMTQAFSINAAAGGNVVYDNNTIFVGCTKVETAASGLVFTNAAAVATTVQGQAVAYAPS